jgi:RIO-like serine/threonine protein kinase
VFKEINEAGKSNDFIVDHIERIRHNGKWVIIIDYIEGITLTEFLKKNRADKAILNKAVIALAKTLTEWHTKGFAHGDPHLDNCLIKETATGELIIYLIDYSQIHHKDFHYCKKFNCFDPNNKKRLNEDIINPNKGFGRGFKFEISEFSNSFGYGNDLANIFDKHYSI